MQFYLAKDYSRAIAEFKKMIKVYPQSELAPDAQYYIGRSYEERRDYYAAFLAYQKVIDVYPRSELTDERIERQYRIGNLYLSGQKEKLLGMEFVPAMDKALEILEKVVANAPYGKYADLAQFKIGECYKKNSQYKEAAEAFAKIVSDYPKSLLYEQARYETAYCTYKMSFKASYDQEPTEEAIKEFEDFIKNGEAGDTLKEADQALTKLQEKKAESLYDTARFYEKRGHYDSALIYYRSVMDEYPNTAWATKAFNKITELEKRIQRQKK
jgi:outer membrane protein assembly factor BamD